MSAWDEQIFPIANYFAKQDRPVSRIAAKRLTNLIVTKEPAQMTSRQLDAVQLVIAETVRVVSAQALVAEDSTSRHYSWNTCDHIFDMLATFRPTTSEPIAPNLKGCRDFFVLHIPNLLPQPKQNGLKFFFTKMSGHYEKKSLMHLMPDLPSTLSLREKNLSVLFLRWVKQDEGKCSWVGVSTAWELLLALQRHSRPVACRFYQACWWGPVSAASG
jgi:hypothetical protein